MRSAILVVTSILATAACGIADISQGGSSSGGKDGGTTSDGGSADAGIQGAGCGSERQTGITLCAATSMCPSVVVDTQAFPSCGFRIRGASVDLVCGCGEQVCPMGVFATCQQAAQLLSTQTEQAVCAQVSEERCTAATSTSTSSSSGGSSSGSTSSGGIGCDKQCVADCGGGSACAAVCNCQ